MGARVLRKISCVSVGITKPLRRTPLAARTRKQSLPATAKETVSAPHEPEFGEILSKLPPGTPPEVLEMISQSMSYSGPLPPPFMMQQYNDTLPGLADRIMKMAENEQGLRRRDNGWILSNDTVRVVGSIVVSLALIAAGVYCGIIGQPWLGGVLGTSGAIAGIASKMLTK
jgi:uncharacterized membrane protein